MSSTSIQGVAGSKILVNPTALEATLADVAWDSLSEVDGAIIRTLVDPATCPLEFLPYLAWAMSVDVWDPSWPESTKRAVVAASPEVHRIKGTRLAVRLALQALGLDVDLVEWWETTPPGRRGTFTVDIIPNGFGPPLDLTLLQNAVQSVKRSKPKSRVFSLRVAFKAPTPIFVAGTAQGIIRSMMMPIIKPIQTGISPLNVGGAYQPLVINMLLMPRRPGDIPMPTPVDVAGCFDSAVRHSILYPIKFS